MTHVEVVLKDGKGSRFSVEADPVAVAQATLADLRGPHPFIAWATTIGTMFFVAKDQIAVIVVNVPEQPS